MDLNRSVARSIGAEVRAVEEGHRAWLADDALEVVSDTRPGVRYRVQIAAVDGFVRFTCDHPIVLGISDASAVTEPGLLACKHAGVVAHRLEREGLARFAIGSHPRWVVTDRTRRLLDQLAGDEPTDDGPGYGLDQPDPFAGFPT